MVAPLEKVDPPLHLDPSPLIHLACVSLPPAGGPPPGVTWGQRAGRHGLGGAGWAPKPRRCTTGVMRAYLRVSCMCGVEEVWGMCGDVGAAAVMVSEALAGGAPEPRRSSSSPPLPCCPHTAVGGVAAAVRAVRRVWSEDQYHSGGGRRRCNGLGRDGGEDVHQVWSRCTAGVEGMRPSEVWRVFN